MQELIIYWLGGNCPVQAEGTVDGKEFYFRARYTSWRMEIGSDAEPEWECHGSWGDGPYAAGWMPEAEARRIIEKCAAEYMDECKRK